MPPFATVVVTVNVRFCCPSPQVALQAPQSLQMPAQSTAAGGGLGEGDGSGAGAGDGDSSGGGVVGQTRSRLAPCDTVSAPAVPPTATETVTFAVPAVHASKSGFATVCVMVQLKEASGSKDVGVVQSVVAAPPGVTVKLVTATLPLLATLSAQDTTSPAARSVTGSKHMPYGTKSGCAQHYLSCTVAGY